MSAAAAQGRPSRPPGLLEKLTTAVRPEFRAGELAFDPRHPVFGGDACRVAGCERAASGRGLCQGHYSRWVSAGKPGLEEFTASADPRWRRQVPPSACQVPGCEYGVVRHGLCRRHSAAWQQAGSPGLEDWAGTLPAAAPGGAPQCCLIGSCSRWAEPGSALCRAHDMAWKRRGRPDVAGFAAGWVAVEPVLPYERIRLGALPAQLRLEVQYALQQRSDQRAGKVRPPAVMTLVRFLTASGAGSLLDRDEEEWRAHPGLPPGRTGTLLAWARREVADLAEEGGWDAEYGRDTWQMQRLGFPGHRVLCFGGIPQPRLKDLAKRWTRWRLASGVSLSACGRALHAITRLAAFLDARGITGTGGIDRSALEAYLAWLQAEMKGRPDHGTQVSLVSGFLTAIRQHRWDDGLPPTAQFFPADYPRRPQLLPRALAEHVMAQVERPASLAREPDPAYRLVTVILIRCGLRVSDAAGLSRDCLITDPAGAPYLRYYNHKMKREALIPIDEELQALIGGQQQRVAARWPAGTPVLFPRPTKNPDGRVPLGSATYRRALDRWLDRCDIRDEHGAPVHLTPHQWRHTLGTRLINRDVPQHVVQKILDHDSAEMTAHYARLSDKTVREHWEKAQKVNAEGQPVQVRADGPLGEAAWAKQRLTRATQALPNGYCELPMVRTCPHANSCLTCPMFVTTAEFLPHHHAQRQATLQIISAAEAAGHARVAEMNRQVAGNLAKIITALEAGVQDDREASSAH